MLRDLSIKNYRCFEDFSIDGLARVNLLVGSNNSGKTSFLEAVALLAYQGSVSPLLDSLENRGEIIEEFKAIKPEEKTQYQSTYFVQYLFNENLSFDKKYISIKATNTSSDSDALSLEIRMQPASPEDAEKYSISHEIMLSSRNYKTKIPVFNDGAIVPEFIDFHKQSSRIQERANYLFGGQNKIFFLTVNNVSYAHLSMLWNYITLTPKEDIVVDALKIIESEVERINFTTKPTANSGILIRLRGKHPTPLGSMGGGMRRILTLVMAAVTVENGILLVDEIDTGLHHEVQTQMWKMIVKIAQNLNIQVFATTHSWDCICAFQEALEEAKDRSVGMLFRLDKKYGELRAVEYTSDDLDTAVHQSIEVR
ncbi:AAA family ATPase [Lusitaniella coriacea]|uniref:AAA family ATPase n=1 Tax=Lusitaniella coriacea TaxID=1983105 RepID=UPI003CFBB9E3